MVAFEFGIHQDLNMISAMFLITLGTIVLLRDKNYRVNQLLSLFFFGLAVFEFFDGLTIAFRSDPSIGFLNALRDVAVTGLTLSLSFAVLACLTLTFGKRTVFRPGRILVFYVFTLLGLVIGMIGDSIPESTWHVEHAHFHTEVSRTIFGIMGIFGLGMLFSLLILYALVTIITKTDGKVQTKLTRFSIGVVLMLAIVLTFDLSAFVDPLKDLIISSAEFHILLHIILFFGEVLILSSFWHSLKSEVSSPSMSKSISN